MPSRPRHPSKQRPPDPSAPGAAMRLFVAVPLPEAVRARLSALTEELSGEGWPVRWVNPDSSHLTLHFLGDTAPERAELLRLALPAAVARHAAFGLRTAGLGVFPSPRRPRVIWLGLHGPTHRLETLQREIGAALRGLDLPSDYGPFTPHLTLGRLRPLRDGSPRDLAAAIQRRLAAETDVARSPLPVPVAEVVLYQSFLSPQGARHQALGRYPLAGAPAPDRP